MSQLKTRARLCYPIDRTDTPRLHTSLIIGFVLSTLFFLPLKASIPDSLRTALTQEPKLFVEGLPSFEVTVEKTFDLTIVTKLEIPKEYLFPDETFHQVSTDHIKYVEPTQYLIEKSSPLNDTKTVFIRRGIDSFIRKDSGKAVIINPKAYDVGKILLSTLAETASFYLTLENNLAFQKNSSTTYEGRAVDVYTFRKSDTNIGTTPYLDPILKQTWFPKGQVLKEATGEIWIDRASRLVLRENSRFNYETDFDEEHLVTGVAWKRDTLNIGKTTLSETDLQRKPAKSNETAPE